jgi:pyrroline-5-carboxylate reductase
MRIAILGCGKIGEAILGGLLGSNTVAAADVEVTARRPERARELAERYRVRAGLDNAAAAAGADLVLVTVKPQRARELLPTLADPLAGRLVVSTCAGVRLAALGAWLPRSRLIRAMPNTPCVIREGMTVLAPGPRVEQGDIDVARRVFTAVGRCTVLEEQHMDVVTGLSGSGPAFALVVLEALADGGVMMGLPRAEAIELAAQTMQGAARLVLASGAHPAALKDEVTTPAGCTIAGLLTMEDGRIRSTLARAIQEATRVAAALGSEPPPTPGGGSPHGEPSTAR